MKFEVVKLQKNCYNFIHLIYIYIYIYIYIITFYYIKILITIFLLNNLDDKLKEN